MYFPAWVRVRREEEPGKDQRPHAAHVMERFQKG